MYVCMYVRMCMYVCVHMYMHVYVGVWCLHIFVAMENCKSKGGKIQLAHVVGKPETTIDPRPTTPNPKTKSSRL